MYFGNRRLIAVSPFINEIHLNLCAVARHPSKKMVFALSPLCSASVLFANSLVGKIYMTSWRLADPNGAPGNPTFDNAHKAQLNEAEWTPFLIGGLMCLHVKGDKGCTIAAALVTYGSLWYLWSRIVCCAKNGDARVLPGGMARYVGALMIAGKLMMTSKTGCPVMLK